MMLYSQLPSILNTFKVRISFCFNVCGLKHLTNNLTIMFCVSLQKLRDIFALVVRKTHMSFCGTPLTPCRKPVSMDTPSESSSAFLFECRKAFVYFVWISYLFSPHLQARQADPGHNAGSPDLRRLPQVKRYWCFFFVFFPRHRSVEQKKAHIAVCSLHLCCC